MCDEEVNLDSVSTKMVTVGHRIKNVSLRRCWEHLWELPSFDELDWWRSFAIFSFQIVKKRSSVFDVACLWKIENCDGDPGRFDSNGWRRWGCYMCTRIELSPLRKWDDWRASSVTWAGDCCTSRVLYALFGNFWESAVLNAVVCKHILDVSPHLLGYVKT